MLHVLARRVGAVLRCREMAESMSHPGSGELYDSAHLRSPVIEEIDAAWRYRPLLIQLVLRDIKTRYKRSTLGLAWVMLNPLLTMAADCGSTAWLAPCSW